MSTQFNGNVTVKGSTALQAVTATSGEFSGALTQSPSGGVNNQTSFLNYGDVFLDFVASGLLTAVPSPASLTGTLAAGTAYVLGQRVVLQSPVTYTYAASSDTYVDLSNVGVLTYSAVANGATAPAVAANSLRLEKVSTSSTSITGVTQLASTQVGVPAATEPNAPLTLSQFQNAPVYTGNFPNGITTSTLSVSGNATIGSQTITGTLAVSGNVTVGNQTTSGNQTIDGTLTVDGDTSLQALTATSGSFSGRVTASTLSLSGPATVANAASSGEAVTLGQADGRYQQREIIVEAGCSGTLSTNAMIGGYVNAIQVNGSGVTATLPASAVGSYAVASASATTGQTIDIVKMASGSQTLTTVGTITFAASGYTGTFSTTSGAAQTFNTGDALYIQVGSSADSTLANVLISLYLTY